MDGESPRVSPPLVDGASPVEGASAQESADLRLEIKHQKAARKAKKLERPANKAFEECNVIVTGFQSRAYDRRASFVHTDASELVARSLPPVLPLTAVHPSRTRISCHVRPIPRTYAGIQTEITEIHETGIRYALILHLDSEFSRLPAYTLKRRAHNASTEETPKWETDRVGDAPQLDNRTLRRSPKILATAASLTDVMTRWKSDLERVPSLDIRTSDDMETGVEEFLFYKSLLYIHYNQDQETNWQDRTTVAFLRLPSITASDSDEESTAEGIRVVVSLINAIIDSRRQKDGQPDPDGSLNPGDEAASGSAADVDSDADADADADSDALTGTDVDGDAESRAA